MSFLRRVLRVLFMTSPSRIFEIATLRRLPQPGLVLALLLLTPSEPLKAAGSVGLSSVRAVVRENSTVEDDPAKAGDVLGWAFAAGDFNGDGIADLATGAPYDDGVADIEQNIGAVFVQLGVAGGGLQPLASAILLDQETGLDSSFTDEHFGWALAVGHFNDDIYDDLAVGVPGNQSGGVAMGGVEIYYGSAAPGVFTTGATRAITGAAGDGFGAALAVGDFDLNGYDDLAVGVPGRSAAAGAVFVIYGDAAGLDSGGQLLEQSNPDIEDLGEANDKFGFSLAAGDFNGDHRDDLAVGVPNENGYGAVQIFFGSASGLEFVHDFLLTQDSIAGTSEPDDKFGYALAAGDFNGDGESDLAIGSPGEALGLSNEITNSGTVTIAYGYLVHYSFDLSLTQAWAQGGILGTDTAELGDRFAASLATGNFDGDAYEDLFIGHPEEDITGTNEGAFSVYMGGETGFTVARSRFFVVGRDGLPGSNQSGSNCGFAAAAGDFDGDGFDELAVGVPYHDGVAADVGMELILRGSTFADGFEDHGSTFWSVTAP
ncbi:MAG: FG-GAP repeat protein [Thermoanaerobaculia bacterium]